MSSIRVSHTDTTTKIHIGSGSGDLPLYLLSGEKEAGFIVRREKVEKWYYQSISVSDNERCITSDFIDIIPFLEITTTLRSSALSLIREVAQSLVALPANSLKTNGGFIETWRLFFIRGGGLLILPEQLSKVINHSVEQEERQLHFLRYLSPKVIPPFALSFQLTQFLYLAVAQVAPFESEVVKANKWRPIPLTLSHPELSSSTASWIDKTLTLSEERQREIASSAYSSEENLKWFIDESSSLEWQFSPLTQQKETKEQLETFCAHQERRYKRRLFLKKRGALILSIGIFVAILLSVGGKLLYNSMQKPPTSTMSASEVVMEFFNARNALDLQRMDTTLARSVKNPYQLEISSLFVTSQMRRAYEGVEAFVPANRWVEEGMGALQEGSTIYGYAHVELQEIKENHYIATYTFYSPIDESHIGQTYERVGITLTDKKGYFQIAEFTILESVELEPLLITHSNSE